MPWSRPLARALRTRGGATLRTLDDARRYLLALPDVDGDVWALGHPDPIDPARVTWLGIAAPPATFDPA